MGNPHGMTEQGAQQKMWKCQKKGHYSRVCHSTVSVDAVHQQEESSDESDECTVGEYCWKIKLKVNNCEETFHIDIGAEVSVIPESSSIGSSTLSKSRRVLRGSGQNKLQVKGACYKILSKL